MNFIDSNSNSLILIFSILRVGSLKRKTTTYQLDCILTSSQVDPPFKRHAHQRMNHCTLPG